MMNPTIARYTAKGQSLIVTNYGAAASCHFFPEVCSSQRRITRTDYITITKHSSIGYQCRCHASSVLA